MQKLFVIGNGFDNAHGLASSYDDFRQFLLDRYLDGCKNGDIMPQVPEVRLGRKGELECDVQEVAAFLLYIITRAEHGGDYWSNLEASLGELDYDLAFDELPEELDEDHDIDEWKSMYNNSDMASDLLVTVPYIKDFFKEWIETIDLGSVVKKKSFSKLISGEDLFLTFNYTDTLEEIYDVKSNNICHIHGKQGEEILFGHGNKADYSEEYMARHVGAERDLHELDEILRKDTEAALKRHKSFFEKIDGAIQQIYSVGFSFGEVDLIYIKEICKRLSEDAVWYLNDFKSEEVPVFEKAIRECGFRGTFCRFSI